MQSKKPRRREDEEVKGAVPAAKELGEKVSHGVHDAIWGRKAQETPMKTAEKNRRTGEKIIASLQAVDFSGLKKTGKLTDEQIADMRTGVKALISKIQSAPTIFDDISELDTILLNAADTLVSAAKEGFTDQAEWCVNAISTGLLLLRDNVPPQRQEDRDKIVKSRIDYMKIYADIIIAYGKINGLDRSIAQAQKTIAEKEAEYAPLCDKIKTMSKTKEGSDTIARIKANLNHPGALSPEDQEFEALTIRTGGLASSILRLRNQQYARIMENEGQMSMAMGFRTALQNQPQLYDQDLKGEYAAVLEEIANKANQMLTDAAAIDEIGRDAEAKMNQIMNGEASQKLAASSNRTIDSILFPENRDTRREEMERQTLQTKLAQQQLELQQKLKRENEQRLRDQAIEAAKNADSDALANMDFDADTDANVQTEDAADADTDDQSIYNMNS